MRQTEIDDVPLVMMAFQGRLMAGVGKALRIYDIGKKKLLRKAENKVYITLISVTIGLINADIWICSCHLEHPRLENYGW